MKEKAITAAFILLVILAGIQNLMEYLRPEMNVILCLMLVPMVFTIKRPGEYSMRYGWMAAGSIFCFHLVHMQTFFLMSIGATILLILEARHGKMGILPLILLVLISPMLQFIMRIFTFPIRLELSRISAEILQSAGMKVSVSGNIFETGGMRFAVDQACMGLNTMIAGLIITTLLIAYAEKQSRVSFTVWKLSVLYSTTMILLLIGNFCRILLIVIFRSPQETLSHELIGLGSLILYVAAPIFLLIRYFTPGNKGPFFSPAYTRPVPAGFSFALPVLITAIFLFNINRDFYRYEPIDSELLALEIPGMEKEMLDTGLAKFQNKEVLLYVKPPCKFWRSDHTPAICWQASGYETEHIRTMEVSGKEVFLAELRKDKEILYTAWWYDNGTQQTLSQFEWRWNTLKGEKPFSLINLTAADEITLRAQCRELLERRVIFSEK
ncbi:MAG: exosortase N [Bacteroidia bacterium]